MIISVSFNSIFGVNSSLYQIFAGKAIEVKKENERIR